MSGEKVVHPGSEDRPISALPGADCKPLRAYSVQDPGSERGEIVFANCNAAARRIGANQIDSEWESVECRRAPEFDSFTPGPVSDMQKLNHGWWLECTGCYRKIADGRVTDEDGEEHDVTPVERHGHVFCTAECETADRLDREARRAAEKVALNDLRAKLMALHPGVTLTGNDHAYVERKDGVYRPKQVMIHFRFTGCVIGDASYRYDEAGEAPAVWVCNGDKDAWASFLADGPKGQDGPSSSPGMTPNSHPGEGQ